MIHKKILVTWVIYEHLCAHLISMCLNWFCWTTCYTDLLMVECFLCYAIENFTLPSNSNISFTPHALVFSTSLCLTGILINAIPTLSACPYLLTCYRRRSEFNHCIPAQMSIHMLLQNYLKNKYPTSSLYFDLNTRWFYNLFSELTADPLIR